MTYEEFVKELVNKGYMFRIFQGKDFHITEWSSYFEDTEDVAYLSLEEVGELMEIKPELAKELIKVMKELSKFLN